MLLARSVVTLLIRKFDNERNIFLQFPAKGRTRSFRVVEVKFHLLLLMAENCSRLSQASPNFYDTMRYPNLSIIQYCYCSTWPIIRRNRRLDNKTLFLIPLRVWSRVSFSSRVFTLFPFNNWKMVKWRRGLYYIQNNNKFKEELTWHFEWWWLFVGAIIITFYYIQEIQYYFKFSIVVEILWRIAPKWVLKTVGNSFFHLFCLQNESKIKYGGGAQTYKLRNILIWFKDWFSHDIIL